MVLNVAAVAKHRELWKIHCSDTRLTCMIIQSKFLMMVALKLSSWLRQSGLQNILYILIVSWRHHSPARGTRCHAPVGRWWSGPVEPRESHRCCTCWSRRRPPPPGTGKRPSLKLRSSSRRLCHSYVTCLSEISLDPFLAIFLAIDTYMGQLSCFCAFILQM